MRRRGGALAAFVLAAAPLPPSWAGPRIYSVDGDRSRLEGEAFPSASGEEHEGTTLVPLASLRVRDRRVVLRLRDEGSETDYVDRVRLLRVDHPRGEEVVLDPSGRLRGVRGWVAPEKAYARDLTPALDEVRSRDGRAWSGPPSERSMSSSIEPLFVVFPRGKVPPRAWLGLRARIRGEGFLRRLTRREPEGEEPEAQPGPIGPGGPKGPEGPPTEKGEEAEGGLPVSLWTGSDWIERGRLPDDLGTEFRDLLVPLGGVSSRLREVRVRIDLPRGGWEIDWIALGRGVEETPPVRRLSPIHAAGGGGGSKEVIGDLEAKDDRSAVLHRGESLDLEFPAEPLASGSESAYFLEVVGYSDAGSFPFW